MKNSLTFFSILFFSIIALASLENDAPPINSETKPVLKVTSKTLYKEYNNNEIAADDKYKGKIIQVRGTIRDIGKDIMDDAYISLIGDDFFGDVQCFFPDKSYLLNLKKGQRVNVIGYCDGLFMNIILQNCIIK
ncbi:MAG: OB-fold protein [Flavobacteriaceae bacterium]|jgi:hypothetical protein|tara:strand:+ start:268 stop:669 length:402 start_codon:yes stop_codon:yes gene_type:complete